MIRKMAMMAGAAALAPAPVLAQASDELVVTASRSDEAIPADRLGGSVTLLDAAALETRQTRIVSDVLRDVPGVAVSRTGAVGNLTQVRLRGTEGNHVLVLIDGIEAADPFQGEFDFATLIAEPDVRIEVLRGQQSSLYGSDAIGGVIQYLTQTGAEAPGVRLRAEGGSFGTASGSARAGGVAGRLDYAVSGAFYHTSGTPTARSGSRAVGSDIASASSKLSWSASDSLKLSAVARYSLTDAESDLTEQDPASPRFGTVVDTPGAHDRSRALYGLVSAAASGLGGRWTGTLSGQGADVRRRSYDAGERTSGDDGRRLKGSLVSSLRFGDGRVRQRLTGAVDVEREDFRNATPFAFAGWRHTDDVGFVGEYALMAGDAASLGGSVRRDENDRFADTTTWRVQGSYRIAPATRLHAAYGTGVKNPGYFDLYGYVDGRYIGNPTLKPELSKGWEAGAEQRFADGGVTIGATYFRSRLEDEIFTDFPAPDFVATPGNRATLSRQQGLEVTLAARPTRDLRVDATYTWLKAREDGTVEVRRPAHVASANATYAPAAGRFSVTATVRYNGRQQDDAFTDPSFVPVRVSLHGYLLANLAAELRLTDALALFGRVENLTASDYEEVFGYATPGRAAYGGVRARF